MREEIRRILSGKFLYLLLAGAMAVNLWFIWNYREQREMVEEAANLKENGVDYVSAQNKERIIEAFADVEAAAVGEYRVENMVEGAYRMAGEFRAEDLADIFVANMKLKDGAEDYARKEYGRLESVMEANREDNTAGQFFVPDTGGVFQLFARMLPMACTAEAVLLAVFLMMRCVNEPFDAGTWGVVYASRTGRNINKIKGAAALLVSLGFAAFLWLAAFLAAEAAFGLGPLWGTRIGSMMVLEQYVPIVSRLPLTVFSYVALQFAVMLAVTAVYGAVAYLFVGRTHSRVHGTLTAFSRMAFACAAVAVFTDIFPRNSVLFFLLQLNPVAFMQKAGHWFVSGGGFLSPRYYEAVFLALACAVLVLLAVRENRKFGNENIG